MGASASLSSCTTKLSSSAPPATSACLIVSIDGNIGSGKTTGKAKLQEYIMSLKTKKKTAAADDSIIFVDEPTCEWEQIKDENDVPILTNLYKDVKRFAFRFQMMAYITRLQKIRQALRTPKVKLIITERCLLTDAHVFAKMLYDSGQIEQDEYNIYTRWFDEFAKEVEPSCIVYFKASTEVCMNRIQKRNRPGENISFDYLEECNRYHNDWLNSTSTTSNATKTTIPTLILNADVDADTYEYSSDIYHFINSLRASRTVGVMHRLKTYIDGSQPKVSSAYDADDCENDTAASMAEYGIRPTYKICREDQKNLIKFGHASFLHFDK
jgi:deoxyadenosine/deoxycytidine kinase